MLGVFVVAMATEAVAAGAATGAAGPPTWSALQTYSSLTVDLGAGTESGSAALPLAIACPGYGNCIAAGYGLSLAGLEPDVMVETGPSQSS